MSAGITPLFAGVVQDHGDPAARRLTEAARIAEALLFAAPEPMSEEELARRLPQGTVVGAVLAKLRQDYEGRGIELARVGAKWLFRTAGDLGWLLSPSGRAVTKLSRAAMETLAIIAYHQPATRAEIEDIRGVTVGKGTLDVLLSTGWIRPRGRRRTPGRPVTYVTTDAFLLHFALETIADLPGLDELRGAGLFDGRPPSRLSIPIPHNGPLAADEEPLEDLNEAEDDLSGEEPGAASPELDEPDGLGHDPFR